MKTSQMKAAALYFPVLLSIKLYKTVLHLAIKGWPTEEECHSMLFAASFFFFKSTFATTRTCKLIQV